MVGVNPPPTRHEDTKVRAMILRVAFELTTTMPALMPGNYCDRIWGGLRDRRHQRRRRRLASTGGGVFDPRSCQRARTLTKCCGSGP